MSVSSAAAAASTRPRRISSGTSGSKLKISQMKNELDDAEQLEQTKRRNAARGSCCVIYIVVYTFAIVTLLGMDWYLPSSITR